MANGFRSAYIGIVRTLAIGGYTSNAEIAARLGKTEAQIRNWRKAVPAFDEACALTIMQANAMVANRAFERALEDDAMTRYYLDRRHPEFMPKQKHDHVSNGNTLKALLAEHGRMDMDEAQDRGLIIDADEYEEIHSREDANEEALDAPFDEALDEYDEDGRPLR